MLHHHVNQQGRQQSGFKWGMIIAFIFAFIMLGSPHAISAANSIVSIQAIYVEVEQTGTYELPKTVQVTMQDQSEETMSVKWPVSKVNTSKLGEYTLKGTVAGTPLKALLTIQVNPKIVKVNLPPTERLVHSVILLPEKVQVVLSNKKAVMRDVTWPAEYVDTSKVGTIKTVGFIENSEVKVVYTTVIKAIYKEVKPFEVTIKDMKDGYTLPTQISGVTLSGKEQLVNVQWDPAYKNVGMDLGDGLHAEGYAEGYPDIVYAHIIFKPTIKEITNAKITVFATDYVPYPKTVPALMSDNSVRDVSVVWNIPLPKLYIPGTYELTGRVKDYSEPVVYTYKVRSDFYPVDKKTTYTQWNYVAIRFSKTLAPTQGTTNIYFKTESGAIIEAKSVSLAVSDSSILIVMPSRPLSKEVKYKLIISKGTVESEEGDLVDDDYTFDIAN